MACWTLLSPAWRRAREGTLRDYIGGEAEDLAFCRPVLEAKANPIVHIGPSGQGLALKLVNKMMCQAGWAIVAEALVMGAKVDIDRKLMIDLIGKATGKVISFQCLGPRWMAGEFEGIRLDITYKDMQHNIDLDKSLGGPMLMATQAQHVYETARCQGLGSEDGVAIIKIYEDLAGVARNDQ